MKFTYFAALVFGAGLMGCNTPVAKNSEFSCNGEEQSQGSYVQAGSMRPIQTNYPIEIDFHIEKEVALIKTYVAQIVSDDGNILRFAIDGGDNWLRGQFDRRDNSLNFLTRQTLSMGHDSLQIQLGGQYVCHRRYDV